MNEDISINEALEIKTEAITSSRELAEVLIKLRVPFMCLIQLPTGEVIRMSCGLESAERNAQLHAECEEYLRFLRNKPDKN